MSIGKSKKCSKCSKEFELTAEFWNRAAHCADGFHTQCKVCRKQIGSEYRKNNAQKVKAAVKKHYHSNKNQKKQYRDEWYANNPDYNKNYYKKNKAKVNAHNAEYWRERYKSDSTFRLKHNFRRRFHHFLCGNITAQMERYIGCTWAELKTHIESLWLDGMSWDNHSIDGWHIDHIIPVSSFDYGDGQLETSLKKCWHFSNLQPLWAEDNLAKSNSLPLL